MTEPSDVAIRLQRTIPAPPERVYRAWLDPELMRRWFAPAAFTVRKAEVDERVGGRLRVWHQDADGHDVGGSESEILELIPNERIVLRWYFVGPDRVADPALESRLTVTLTPGPNNGTLLELSHERLGGLRTQMPEIADNVGPGWESTLGALVDAVGAGDRRRSAQTTYQERRT